MLRQLTEMKICGEIEEGIKTQQRTWNILKKREKMQIKTLIYSVLMKKIHTKIAF